MKDENDPVLSERGGPGKTDIFLSNGGEKNGSGYLRRRVSIWGHCCRPRSDRKGWKFSEQNSVKPSKHIGWGDERMTVSEPLISNGNVRMNAMVYKLSASHCADEAEEETPQRDLCSQKEKKEKGKKGQEGGKLCDR